MRIAMCLAGDGTKTKAARLIIAGALKAAVINHQHFRMAHLEKQLAIIGVDKRVTDDRLGIVAVERAAAEENIVGRLEMIHVLMSLAPHVRS